MLKKVTKAIEQGGFEWQESKIAKWFNDKMEEPIVASGPINHPRHVYSSYQEDEALVRKLNREQLYQGFPVYNEIRDWCKKVFSAD